MDDYYGFPIRSLSTSDLELNCLETAGPRIVGLRYKGALNLFAEVPEISIATPYGDYKYLGGHRLWHSPEVMPRSYVPDDNGLTISKIHNGLLLDGKTEPHTFIHKRIQIKLHPEKPQVVLTHTLINKGLWDVELSPWALTMFRLGGTAILPIDSSEDTADQLLPNRHFSLWSYTKINDPRLRITDKFVLLEAKHDFPPLKIGAFNSQGWIAYWIDGVLFQKRFDVFTNLRYPDYGSNAEIYADDDFVELESLAPLTKLAPGESVNHVEVWELFDNLDQDFLSSEIIDLLID